MDGIHDLGGKHGFGPVHPTGDEEPAFHAPWEARLLAIVRALTRPAGWSRDLFRAHRECIEPVRYLTRPYFDQWCSAYGAMLVASGIATVDELARGRKATAVDGLAAPMDAAKVAQLKTVSPRFDRPSGNAPAFALGARVRTHRDVTTGHTRLPAYARDRVCVVTALHGAHVLPDAINTGAERAEPLYTVRFAIDELFPEQRGSADAVHLDLWESYLAIA